MANLLATFKLVDEMSSKLDNIANSGSKAVEQWESAGSAADTAFGSATSSATQTAQSMTDMSSSANGLKSAVEDAASSTDYWTDALGNYDKSAMEAIYSTEELVELGYKTEAALEAEAKAAEETARAAGELAKASEDTAARQEDMGNKGKDAVDGLKDALVAAGIAITLKEIAEAAYALADAFSEAESVVVKATGATGAQLDSLNQSMLRVYSNIDDGDMTNTAGAIGEINTRLGLQGEELENVATLFLMYADNTNSSVVPAVESVTKVMKNWGVEADGTELLLDKLTYAAQTSGASVDMLSNMVVTNKATLQQLGYGLDESIGLLSMFEHEGLNASSIMMGFRSAVTNFSDEGLDASVAMQEVIGKIGSMADESEATSLAIETFGSRAGAELAYAIRNSKFEIEKWVTAIDKSGGTLAKTDVAADTLADKWTQASNKMNTAFSGVISPAIDTVSSGLAGIVDGAGTFLNEHPAVVAALTGIAVGLAIVTIATQAQTVATIIHTVAEAALNAVMLLNPVFLIAAGVAALVTAVVLFVGSMDDANEEYNSLTATSKKHYDQLEELNAEYEQAVELYGENSTEAQKLADEIAGLEAVYETTKMTLEEFVAQNDALIESHDKLIESYKSSMSEISKEDKNTTSLIGRLEELSSKTDLTAAEQQQMIAITDKLNERMPDLALSYDKVTGSLGKSITAVKALAQAEAQEQRQVAQHKAYVDSLAEQADLQEQLAKAVEQTQAAQERKDDVGGLGWFGESKQAKKDLEAFTTEQERLQAALDECNVTITETEKAWDEAENAVADYETGVNKALQSISSEMDELVQKHDEAYISARDSLDGTVGLFEKAEIEAGLSSKGIIDAWQSQIDFFNQYNDNLKKLEDVGIDPELLKKLSDGSAESVGQVKTLADELGKLDTSGADAAVDKINAKFGELTTAKDTAATTMADIQTDFSTTLDEMQTKLTESIDGVNMDTEAAAAAKETMSAYIASIKSKQGEAVTAAKAVANATAAALNTKYTPGVGIGSITVPGHASGTTSAENIYIAGEEGPELIVGAAGSTVFPTDETEKILSSMASVPLNTSVPDNLEPKESKQTDSGNITEKKITLEIAGSGEMTIDRSMDKNTVLDILYNHIKPVLSSILKQEIYEEGDLAYDY